MKKAIIAGFLLILLVVGFLYARHTSTLFNYLFPPLDMFVSLATKEADLTRTGKTELQFQTKYPGYHELDLEVDKFDFNKPFAGSILLEISIKNSKGEAIIKRRMTELTSTFMGIDKKGFVLQSFVVPETIRLGEKGTVEISIITPDKDFYSTYGNARFTIKKGADE